MKRIMMIALMALLSHSMMMAAENNNVPADTLKGKDGNMYVISKDAKGEVTGILVIKKDAKGKMFVNSHDLTAPARTPNTKRDGDVVFDVVEEMPSFPGGMEGMMTFMMKNMKYPADAQKNKVQGRVMLTFIVNKDGSLKDIKVVRSVYPSLDEEAIRVVKAMPKWTPGKQNGKPVNVRFTVPIVFRLN